VDAVRASIGFVPRPADIDLTGLDLAPNTLEKLLDARKEDWLEDIKGIKEFLKTFKKDLSNEMWEEYERLKNRLKADER
jgi:phosphoenolpyruvate carboxykinase (GTP)